MTKAEIIIAAVQAEAIKHGIVDKALDLFTKNDAWVAMMNGIPVTDGEAVATDVRKLVTEMREKHPAVFMTPDANKLSEADFEKLENELRKGTPREIEKMPAHLSQIDASELNEQENEALEELLRGSKQGYYHGIVELAARRQGLTPADS